MENSINGSAPESNNALKLAISWAIVGIPSLWAVWQVIVKTVVLFQ